MFYLIGIGLKGIESMSTEGYDLAKKCSPVYLDTYTSLVSSLNRMKKEFRLIEAGRELIEQEFDPVLLQSKKKHIALLVIGDVFGETTHHTLLLRARELGVPFKIIGG